MEARVKFLVMGSSPVIALNSFLNLITGRSITLTSLKQYSRSFFCISYSIFCNRQIRPLSSVIYLTTGLFG